MLICVKEKKNSQQAQNQWDGAESDMEHRRPKCTLKGSILIKKHLKQVEAASGKTHDQETVKYKQADVDTRRSRTHPFAFRCGATPISPTVHPTKPIGDVEESTA
jgi:hypothetical protein